MVMYCICIGVNWPSRHRALWFKTQRSTAHRLPGGRPGGVQAYKLPPLQASEPAVATLVTASSWGVAASALAAEVLDCSLAALFAPSKEAEEALPLALDDMRVLADAGRENVG